MYKAAHELDYGIVFARRGSPFPHGFHYGK